MISKIILYAHPMKKQSSRSSSEPEKIVQAQKDELNSILKSIKKK